MAGPLITTLVDAISLVIYFALANALIFYYKTFRQKLFIEEYKKRLFFLGEKITVTQGNESYTATAVDIDEQCHLTVKTSDGELKTLSSGEISIKLD